MKDDAFCSTRLVPCPLPSILWELCGSSPLQRIVCPGTMIGKSIVSACSDELVDLEFRNGVAPTTELLRVPQHKRQQAMTITTTGILSWLGVPTERTVFYQAHKYTAVYCCIVQCLPRNTTRSQECSEEHCSGTICAMLGPVEPGS